MLRSLAAIQFGLLSKGHISVATITDIIIGLERYVRKQQGLGKPCWYTSPGTNSRNSYQLSIRGSKPGTVLLSKLGTCRNIVWGMCFGPFYRTFWISFTLINDNPCFVNEHLLCLHGSDDRLKVMCAKNGSRFHLLNSNENISVHTLCFITMITSSL